MRKLVFGSILIALSQACQCDEQLGKLSPRLSIVEPEPDLILDFGSVRLGTTAERSIVVVNHGSIAGNMTELTVAGDSAFSLPSTEPVAVAIEATRAIAVRVTP